MKISAKQLRNLIKEVALSPALPKNNQIVNDPIANDAMHSAIDDVQRQFVKTLEKNLVLSAWDHSYNEKSREFDDDTYEFIKSVSDKLGEEVTTLLTKAIKQAWIKGHTTVKSRRSAA